MNIKRQLGFTIIELMMTITVAMIVLGIGVPNFISIVRSNDTITEVNHLATALNLARSEAVARGIEVTIVPQSGADWTTGWLVGIDSDEDDTFPEAGEPILRTFDAVNSLTFAAAPLRIEFKPTGEVSALVSFAMVPTHCNDADNRQPTTVADRCHGGLCRLNKTELPLESNEQVAKSVWVFSRRNLGRTVRTRGWYPGSVGLTCHEYARWF